MVIEAARSSRFCPFGASQRNKCEPDVSEHVAYVAVGGDHARSRIEARMRCLKAFGERIAARVPGRQTAEIHIRIVLMNRFSALGTAEIVRVAWRQWGTGNLPSGRFATRQVDVPLQYNGKQDGAATILLSHDAGTSVDAGLMEQIAAEFVARECRTARFQFACLADRRQKNLRRPLL